MDRFPHLLWSKAVLFGMLNALQKLNIYVDDEEVQEVKVGRMKRKVILMDTLEARQEIMQLFAQRSKDFIKTSVEWAPNTVQSHLQEYINAGKYLLSYFTLYFFCLLWVCYILLFYIT